MILIGCFLFCTEIFCFFLYCKKQICAKTQNITLRDNAEDEGEVDLENNDEPNSGIGLDLVWDEGRKLEVLGCRAKRPREGSLDKTQRYLDWKPGFKDWNPDWGNEELETEVLTVAEVGNDFHEERMEAEGTAEHEHFADERGEESEDDTDSMASSLSSISKEVVQEEFLWWRQRLAQTDDEMDGGVGEEETDVEKLSTRETNKEETQGGSELKTQREKELNVESICTGDGLHEENFLNEGKMEAPSDLDSVVEEVEMIEEHVGGLVQRKQMRDLPDIGDEEEQNGKIMEGYVVDNCEEMEREGAGAGGGHQDENGDEITGEMKKTFEESVGVGLFDETEDSNKFSSEFAEKLAGEDSEKLGREDEKLGRDAEMLAGEDYEKLRGAAEELGRDAAEKQGVSKDSERLGGEDIGKLNVTSGSVNVMVNCEKEMAREVISEQAEGKRGGSGEIPMASEVVKELSTEEAYEQWRLPWLGSIDGTEESPIETAILGESIQTSKVLEKTYTEATSLVGGKQRAGVFSTETGSKDSAVKVPSLLKPRGNIKFAEIKGKGIAFREKSQQKVALTGRPGGKYLTNEEGNEKTAPGRQEFDDDDVSNSSSSESETSEDETSSASDNGGWEDCRLGIGRHYPTFPPPPPPLLPPPSPLSAPPVSYYSRQHLEPQKAPAWPGSSAVRPDAAVLTSRAGVLSAGPVSYWTFPTPPPPLHQPPPSYQTSEARPPSTSSLVPSLKSCSSSPLKPSDWQSPSTLPLAQSKQSKTSPSPLGPMFIQTPPAANIPLGRSSTPAPSSMLDRIFQLSGTPILARHDSLSSPKRTLTASPARHMFGQSPSPPSQVYSAAEYWRRHKEEERKVEEEKLHQEKELIMKEAQRFVEQKRAAEEKKALAMKRWLTGEEKEVAVEEHKAEHGLLNRENILPEMSLVEEKRGDSRADEISQQKMLAQAKVLADEMWIAEEKKVAQEKREAAQAEEKRIAEENYKKLADEKWRIDLERLAELQKLAREKKEQKLADEKRVMEEKRLAEVKKNTEEKKLAEENKKAQEEKLAQEKRKAEQKKLAEMKKTEEKKLAEEMKASEDTMVEAEKKMAETKKPQHLMDLSSSAGLAELLRLADEETLVEEKFAFEEESFTSEDSTEDEGGSEEEGLIVDSRIADERLLDEPGQQGWIKAKASHQVASLSADRRVMSEDGDDDKMGAGSEKRRAEAEKLRSKRLRMEEQYTPLAEECTPLEEPQAEADMLEEKYTPQAEAKKLEELGRKRLRLEERRAEISLKMEALKVAGVY